MEQLAEGLWHSHAEGRTLPPYEGTECYWVGSPAEVVLVDTGDGGEAARTALERDWRALGRPRVAAVVLTHRHSDHSGGAEWAQRLWAAPVLVHPEDLEAVRRRAGGATLTPHLGGRLVVGGVAVELLHAPGHTPGQLNLWLPHSRFLLAGDNVLGRTTSVLAPPDGDLRAYLATLRRLLALQPARIGPGHGPVVGDGAAYLRFYLEHRAERERQVLALLRDGPRSPQELADSIYREQLPAAAAQLGEWMVRSQLAALEAEGRVVARGDGRYALAADS